MNKLVVILGPTSSGKSSLAIKLARKFNGEIISADSRQVYKGMDLGTGKVTKKEQKIVPHYLLDIVSPKKQFTVSDFKKRTKRAIAQIVHQNKIPFLVGGTAFYIYSLIDDWHIPDVKPDKKLRSMLRSKSNTELFAILKKLDPRRAKTIDKNNPARLIRAIEIVKTTGKPIPTLDHSFIRANDSILILGLNKPQKILYKLIDLRLKQRLKQGMIVEVKKLLKTGVSFKRLDELGLEYRFVAKYLKKELDEKQLFEQLSNAIHHFSKRQMTWFKRDKRIKWVQNQKQAEQILSKFLR